MRTRWLGCRLHARSHSSMIDTSPKPSSRIAWSGKLSSQARKRAVSGTSMGTQGAWPSSASSMRRWNRWAWRRRSLPSAKSARWLPVSNTAAMGRRKRCPASTNRRNCSRTSTRSWLNPGMSSTLSRMLLSTMTNVGRPAATPLVGIVLEPLQPRQRHASALRRRWLFLDEPVDDAICQQPPQRRLRH